MCFSLSDHSRGKIEEKKVTKLNKHCSEMLTIGLSKKHILRPIIGSANVCIVSSG